MTRRPGFDVSDKSAEEIHLAETIVRAVEVWYAYVPEETAYEAAQAAIMALRVDDRVLVSREER